MAHDNYFFHVPHFNYFISSIKHGFGLPHWFASWDEIPVGVNMINFSTIVPYRFVGYFLGGVLKLDPLLSYKLTVTIGVLTCFYSFYFFLRELFKHSDSALWGTLLFASTGFALTPFHQEQVIATFFWAPWLGVFLLKTRENPWFFYPFSFVFGISLTCHYPHIYVLSTLAGIVLFLIFCKKFRKEFLLGLRTPQRILPCLLLLAVGASPLYTLLSHKEDLASPVRKARQIETTTLQEYLAMNNQQRASIPAEYYENLFSWDLKTPNADKAALYFPKIAFVLFILILILRPMATLPGFLFLITSVVFASGINTPVPSILFLAKFPGISVFRQWYHFFPWVIASLCILSTCFAFTYLKRFPNVKIKAVLFVLVALCVLESWVVFRHYRGSYLKGNQQRLLQINRQDFLSLLNDNFKNMHNPFRVRNHVQPIMTFRDSWTLKHKCLHYRYPRPFFVEHYFFTSVDLTFGPRNLDRLCGQGFDRFAVLGSSSLADMSSLELTRDWLDNFKTRSAQLKEIQFGPAELRPLTPVGIAINSLSVSQDSVFVLPYHSSMTKEIQVNGAPPHKMWPLFGGAMTAIFLEKGSNNISLKAPMPWIYWACLIHLVIASGLLFSRKGFMK